jgi:isoquinoline 1-oxidoreductase beta subunit
MNSLFWTLPKSNPRTNPLSTWGEALATNKVPSTTDDDARDFSYNAFIQESTLDEIATAGGMDPLELRRQLMAPYPVARELIDVVARMSNWQTQPAKGSARGFALAYSGGAWVAGVVEISEHDSAIRIDKVFCAASQGVASEAWATQNRIETGIKKALSAATGRSFRRDTTNLLIEVQLVANSGSRGGAQGPAAWPAAPALANAIFALTGNRIRRTPLGDEVDFV